MGSSKSFRFRKACLFIPLGLITLCLLEAAASALSNLSLPQHSTTIDRLSDLEKARLSEVSHLRSTLGDAVWPGWSQADIPLMVYNEQYAFLVGYPNPLAGWMKVPALEPRGGSWEEVPGDTFENRPYYRTLLTDPQKTPEGFTVLVGDRWVATFQTREYGEVEFYRGFREKMPSFISSLVPVRLAWAWLMGKTDSYIAALEHESFHAYEGILAANRLAAAERSASVGDKYPFDSMEAPWKQEMDVLVRAAQAGTGTEAIDLVRQFLQMRTARRTGLSAEQVDYERLREWEEGLAKYAELEITRQAGAADSYHPIDGMSRDADFKNYQGQQQFWSAQLREAKNTQGRSGDTRFYYSGNALAVVLDRLLPGWKLRALPGGEFLDDLLQEAVSTRTQNAVHHPENRTTHPTRLSGDAANAFPFWGRRGLGAQFLPQIAANWQSRPQSEIHPTAALSSCHTALTQVYCFGEVGALCGRGVTALLSCPQKRVDDMAKHILIVDDDALMRRSLAFNLEQAGYRASTAATAEDALAMSRRDPPDLVLLDIGLPGMDGLDALRHFKQQFLVPVIFLTARRRELDEVVGLELGADDYITKPFDVDVLLAHLKAVLRRTAGPVLNPTQPAAIQAGDLQIDPTAHTVLLAGNPVELTPREFDLLYTFALEPNRVYSVDDLLGRVWGAEFIGQPQVVYVHIRWLREKIEEDPNRPHRIVTVRGVGYKFQPREA